MLRAETMQARIMKYKVRKSMKRALFIRNGKPYPVVTIHIGKTFKAEDAKDILGLINSGRF